MASSGQLPVHNLSSCAVPPGTQREGIDSIAMDMWDPYLASIREYVPRAEEKDRV
jgi:hypothetical protein